MVRFFTFCVDIGRHPKAELQKVLDLLVQSLDFHVSPYELIVFTNFDVSIKSPSVQTRPYYDKQHLKLYADPWLNLSFNKINVYADLRKETEFDYIWIDLDTVITADISYLQDLDNVFLDTGGDNERKETLFTNNNIITVPRYKYLQGNFWKLNLILYDELIQCLFRILKNGWMLRFDLQDLFNYYHHIEGHPLNVLGRNVKPETVNGLVIWSRDSLCHANLTGLQNLYYDENHLLRSKFHPNHEIHIVSFTFFTLRELFDKPEFKNLFSFHRCHFQNEEVYVNLPYDNPRRHHFYQWFPGRDNCEPMFRLLIKYLYDNNLIDCTKNIVDLGAWIGDNALPWAMKILGTVYAIDPSEDNIKYIELLCRLNRVRNIKTFQKAIAEKECVVYANGDLRHIEFNTQGGSSQFTTTTLDKLMESGEICNVGFIHLDVEGFEQKVLDGSLELIKKYQPVICWENHLEKDDHEYTKEFLKKLGYATFMINEKFPHCRPDCRNFISIPSNSPIIPLIGDINQFFLDKHVGKANDGSPLLI